MEGFGTHEVIVIKNLGPEINVEDLASLEETEPTLPSSERAFRHFWMRASLPPPV